ncbi:hypothetical protein F4808DRAFT_415829 [Astrocystis sublimbata]|nr:hypothetical protein F4808DRAFT_415829 [Astrocystis sublimbata]
MQIQNTQLVLKKERAASNGTSGSLDDGDKKLTEEEQLGQEYVNCMRRLQTNLAFLAGLADKERKPSQPAQPHPVFLKPPPLNASIKRKQAQMLDQNGKDVMTDITDREETVKSLWDLYKKLQALYPDVDPNKEPGVRPPGQAPGSAQSGTQTPSQASPVPGKQPTPTLANMGVPGS